MIGQELRPHLDNTEAVKFYESLEGVKYQQFVPLAFQNGAKSSDWLPNGKYSQQFINECHAQAMPRAKSLADSDVLSIIYVLAHISSDLFYAGKAKEILFVCVIIRRQYVVDDCDFSRNCKKRFDEYPLDGGWTEHDYADEDYTRSVMNACNAKYGWRASSSMRTDNLKPGHIPRGLNDGDSRLRKAKKSDEDVPGNGGSGSGERKGKPVGEGGSGGDKPGHGF